MFENRNYTKLAERILAEIIKKKPKSFDELEKIKNEICGITRENTISNVEMIRAAKDLNINLTPEVRKILQKRGVRTESGVAPLTILTKPFSCPGKCVFCPQEKASKSGVTLFERDLKNKSEMDKVPDEYKKPGADVMPKSYFSNEPAASRALLSGFDPFLQVKNRLRSLELTGHDTSKIELIILGGTFSAIANKYRTWFVTRALQALNDDKYESKTALEKAQIKNEKAPHRAIAIVIETRPDFVDEKEIKYLRKLGCTKVELGVQSTDDKVLKLCKRGHGKKESINAVKLLKDAGFKIGIHIMPGLPGSTPKKDVKTFKELFDGPDFQPDFLKIYPCTVVPFSELEMWQKKGKFKPLNAKELFPLLLELKKIVPPWVRISRLVRDIPATSITAGSKTTNMRQLLLDHLKKTGEKCECIRCREIKSEKLKVKSLKLIRRDYEASGGLEIFLSYEASDKLAALLRLRIPSWFYGDKSPNIFSALKKAAIIRELHTYGAVVPVGEKDDKKAQHAGLGKQLVQEAEKIVNEEFGIKKIAVISGIGAKEFWRKLNYGDEGYYLIKN